ncbi:LamG-like jellyroll fold domain-containing protein [Haladaptatus sp. DFWS20]|uniref:LamG-like jellyroll fold domain-containing protein n=1 Tax=Haladaptatus sp. DFWS20 TaxID=3403467 RepID=UPI003EB8F659
MTELDEKVESFLVKNPQRVSTLREIMATDERCDCWTMEDVSVDSEAVTELVNAGIVVRSDDGLKIADRSAVHRVIESKRVCEASNSHHTVLPPQLRGRVLVLFALVSALALMVGVRVIFIQSLVFRNGDVILASNDPYFYRYWVERLTTGPIAFDLGSLSHLPETVENHDVLLLVTLWGIASLAGGTPEMIGVILAWYPIIAALICAILVYLLTVRLTDDRRVGVAAVTLLAITPIYATRTALGFADHNAFDNIWLVLTVFSIVVLTDDQTRSTSIFSLPRMWRRRIATITLGVSIAAQVLAWRGGPLFLLPIVFYVLLKAIVDVSAERSPLVENRQLVVGLGLGLVLTYVSHIALGWLPDYRTFTPMLLFVAMVTILGIAEGIYRRGIQTVGLTAAIILLLLAVLIGFLDIIGSSFMNIPQINDIWTLFANPIETLLNYFDRTGRSKIGETYPLLGTGGGFDMVFQPFRAFGFVIFVALPFVVWASWISWRERRTGWMAVCLYVWYFFVLALIQVRFAEQLALFVVPFAGLGVVHLVTKGRLQRPEAFKSSFSWRQPFGSIPLPSIREAAVVFFIFLLIVPTGVFLSGVHVEGLGVGQNTYETATWIDEYAAEQNLEYPNTYVFSEWSQNRFYNYIVSGESETYWFAQDHYSDFIFSEHPEGWAEGLETRDRAGFIVTRDYPFPVPEQTMYVRLHKRLGSRGDGVAGLEHYRAIYSNDDGSRKVFKVVPGARVVGTASPGERVTVEKQVRIDGGQFVYRRSAQANSYGVFNITVPYPGKYAVDGTTKTVSQQAITAGRTVRWHNRNGLAYWPFDEVQNSETFDKVGGHRGSIIGTTATRDGVCGEALSFGKGNSYVNANVTTRQQFTVSMWIRPNRVDTTAKNDYRHVLSSKGGFFLVLEENGELAFHVPGTKADHFAAGKVPTNQWTHVTATYDGRHRTIYMNGRQVGRDRISNGSLDWNGQLRMGSGYEDGNRHAFNGAIDEVQIYGQAVNPEKIPRCRNGSSETAENA